jgi:hypothetical protein
MTLTVQMSGEWIPRYAVQMVALFHINNSITNYILASPLASICETI